MRNHVQTRELSPDEGWVHVESPRTSRFIPAAVTELFGRSVAQDGASFGARHGERKTQPDTQLGECNKE